MRVPFLTGVQPLVPFPAWEITPVLGPCRMPAPSFLQVTRWGPPELSLGLSDGNAAPIKLLLCIRSPSLYYFCYSSSNDYDKVVRSNAE